MFKFFLKVCLVNNLINDIYHNYHNMLLDPILKIELPLQKEKNFLNINIYGILIMEIELVLIQEVRYILIHVV